MRGLLIINPRSGDEGGAGELERAAAQRGLDVHVLGDGDDVSELAANSAGDVLGMAGGDGSLSAIAAVALETDRPLLCIPFGTRNHFARDLGLPEEPLAALGALDGTERRIDVGRVGDRIFLNNVVLGVYARLVHRREHHRRRREALARLRAIWMAVRQRHPSRFTVDGKPLVARVLLVANNEYQLDPLSIGERERLDEGRLHLYAAHGVLRRSWEERSGERFEVDGDGHRLRAAIDGEPEELDAPLRFTIEPRALRVLVPPVDDPG